MGVVIQATGLSKRYTIGNTAGGYSRLTEDITDFAARLLRRRPGERVEATARELWALSDVSFEIKEGEIVGVIGRNGAGKTTLLKVMARITEPTRGHAIVTGRVGSLLEVGTGFHPELTGRENVFLNGAILGMGRAEIRAKFDDIVGFAEVERFIDTPVKRYSSGMHVRLAFAVAAYLEPEILFIDEVLSVGDQAFQQRCLGRMGEISKSGRTILYVSHNLASVSALCDRALLIDGGRLVMDTTVDRVLDHYLSGIQTSAGHSLDHREDREGDGSVIVQRVDVSGPDGGPVRTGERCSIRLQYVATASFDNVVVSIAVEGPFSEPLFDCSSEVSGDDLSASSEAGTFVCTIPTLPLLAGRYSVTIYVRAGGVVADKVTNAVYFDVFEGDVFGTGRLPNPQYGRIVIDHSWSTEAKLAKVN